MRSILSGLVALVVSGCVTAEEQAQQAEASRQQAANLRAQAANAADRSCQSYGFVKGTEAYASCRMQTERDNLRILIRAYYGVDPYAPPPKQSSCLRRATRPR